MRKYFGTDGIRRIANIELSPELVYKVAKAGAYVLSKHTDKAPTILIGRDTRLSGTLIESAMVAGFLSYGANVKLLGVMPTPAVAYLTRKLNADASVVISASHNTFEFNGIKYFSNKGMKIPDELEEEIEEVMESGKLDELTAVKDKIGVSEVRTDLLDEYVLNVLKNSGWSDGRKQDITQWIQILTEEGYIVNEYAKSILSELGDLQVRVSSDKNHLGGTMHFNPVNAASGEYDRMEIFNQASNEELFPIGECYDWVIYVSDSKKVYLGDWMSLSIAGDTIEDFLNNIFNPQFQLKEIYTNKN